MNTIDNFINEKLKIDKNTKVVCNSNNALCSEVQNETYDDYAYSTFEYSKGMMKYNYGFLITNLNDEFYSITGANVDSENIEDLLNELSIDANAVGLFDLEKGEYIDANSFTRILRIW